MYMKSIPLIKSSTTETALFFFSQQVKSHANLIQYH